MFRKSMAIIVSVLLLGSNTVCVIGETVADSAPLPLLLHESENSGVERSMDIKILREKLQQQVKNANANPEEVLKKWQPDGSFSGIDYKSTLRSGWTPVDHLTYVKTMVLAAYSEGNTWFDNRELKEKIAKSLHFWVHGGRTNSDNWWYEQIGIPQKHADILLFDLEGVTQDELKVLNDEAAKGSIFTETIEPRITERPVLSTGANLMDKLVISFKIAVATENETEVERLVKLLENELRVFAQIRKDEFGEDAEGIKPDYSFHQHVDQLQFGGYGEVFVNDVNTVLSLISGTKYMVNEKALNEYLNFILDGMQWAFRNEYRDITTSGRAITRQNGSKGIYNGVKKAAGILKEYPNLVRYDELLHLIKGRLGEQGDTFAGNRHFWLSDFMAHKRSGYHIGIKIASNRTKLGEVINGENLLGYYLSDGVTNIMRRGDEYENIYPVWDWNKLPGTTTLQGGLKPLEDYNQWLGEHLWNWKGNNSFVGGVSDGMYGAVVMDYTRDGMDAKKAWFLFDDEMVALGNGINTYTDMPVYTNINQALLKGDVLIGRRGKVTKAQMGKTEIRGTDYILHDGIGYLLAQNAELVLETRTGDWGRINKVYQGKSETKDVFQLGINHGKKPKNAKYQYITVLDTDEKKMNLYAYNKPVSIIQNNDTLQAVYHKDLQILQAVVRKGENPIYITDGLTVKTNKKCLLMVQVLPDGNLKITASNPENQTKDLWVTVNKEFPVISDRVVTEGGKTTIRFTLPEGVYAGSDKTYDTRTGFIN